MSFVFWFFLVGFIIAALQDLKRREVDNWLNLFLFFSGFVYVLYQVFYYNEISFLVNFGFLSFVMISLAYLFYFSKVFAGGDCKLLFAATPVLVSFDFMSSMQNVLFFCLTIFFVGAIYGIFWIGGLFIKDFSKNRKDFFVLVKKNYIYLVISFVFLILGIFEKSFLVLFFLSCFLAFVFFASKVVEKNSLIRGVFSKELKEGDWLENDLVFRGRKIKASFEGLSLEDINFLKNYKKSIKIKEGIPYAPVFVFSWVIFYFRGWIMEVLSGLI